MKTNLLSLLIILLSAIHANTMAQCTNSDFVGVGIGHIWTGVGDYLGYTNAANLNFHVGGTQYMQLDGTINTGFVGIGTAFSPGFRLDVWDDINIAPQAVNFINNGYRIGGNLALYLPGDPSNWQNTFVGRAGNININPALAATGLKDTYVGYSAGLRTSSAAQENVFVGVRAGEQILSTTGATYIGYEAGRSNSFANSGGSDFNTFVGYQSGFADVSSGGNSFFGAQSGFNNASLAAGNTANENTFIGSFSGWTNVSGSENTFVGHSAGLSNLDGIQNTFMGNHSGEDNIDADLNSFYGYFSGQNTVDGSFNTFIGGLTGTTNTFGTFNTCLGYLANVDQDNLINTSAIGHNARVMADDQMILGGWYQDIGGNDHTVDVGIGLSHVNPGPGVINPISPTSCMLEINAINFTGAGNDVDALWTNPVPNPWNCGSGASGLRFRDLTSGSTPCDANGMALSVNSTGDVILIPSVGFGPCSTPPFATLLTDNVGINFNEKSVYFSDPYLGANTNNNDVGIGWPCGSALQGKLDVVSLTRTTLPHDFFDRIAGKFWETGTYQSPPAAGTAEFVGVLGNSDVRDVLSPLGTKRVNLGGDFYASQTVINIGARGTAIGPSYQYNIGLNGIAMNAPVNIAVYGDLFALPPPCLFPAPPPCIAPTGPANYAGYFNGDLVSTSAIYVASDANLKQNIQDMTNPLDIINQLQPKSYTYNQSNPSIVLASNTHYGLLAQDVYNVLPQLTKDCVHPARFDTLGNEVYSEINYKAVNYTELIPFLIAGMKEQQAQIENLENLVEELTLPNMAAPQGEDNESGNSIDVTLSSKTIVLNQNVPNPFKEQTTIEYFIPDDGEQVKIIFTDNKGSVLKEVEITEKGRGQLNVYAADLSSGIYMYTIVADGITVDTKQMVKTK